MMDHNWRDFSSAFLAGLMSSSQVADGYTVCRETRVKIIHLNSKAFKIRAKRDKTVVHNVPERQENSELLTGDSPRSMIF